MKNLWVESNLRVENQLGYSYTPSFLAKSTFFYIQSAGHFLCGKDYFTRREGDTSFLLLYTLNGKGYAKYRDKRYTLTKDQILLINCYEYQEYFSDPDHLWEIKWIHFNGASSEQYFNLIYKNYGSVIDMKNNQSVIDGINKIMELLVKADVQFEIKASNVIVEILTHILLIVPDTLGSSIGGQRKFELGAVFEYIENNYNSDISLDDMAATACCSKYYFTRVFKRSTGYSP